MRNLDISALRALKMVSELGGVTKAAAYLNLTQSAVSMQLKRLEETAGLALFDRTNRQINLTSEGELLLSYAKRMLDLNDEVWARLTADKYEGEVVFGVPHDIVYPHIPKVLKRFGAAYPKVRVRLVSSYTMSLLDGFKKGELDVILTTERHKAEGRTPLATLELAWVGAKGGRVWKERPLRLASQERCIFRRIAVGELEAHQIPWEMAVDTDSSMTVTASLSADIGIEARIGSHLPSDLEAIDHAGQLPDLPPIFVHSYVRPKREAPLANHLHDMLLQVYQSE